MPGAGAVERREPPPPDGAELPHPRGPDLVAGAGPPAAAGAPEEESAHLAALLRQAARGAAPQASHDQRLAALQPRLALDHPADAVHEVGRVARERRRA